MNPNPNNIPAFPNRIDCVEDGEMIPMDQSGMSLKDYFAAAAMQGMLASDNESSEAKIASAAYYMAEAMLAEREKRMNK